MGKTFTEIFTESISVFKKTFLLILAFFGLFVGISMAITMMFPLIIGKGENWGVLFVIIAAAVLITILYYLFYCYAFLIVRNNVLTGKSFLKETFVEAGKKLWKVLFAGLLLGIVFLAIYALCAILFRALWVILAFPFAIVVIPPCFTVFCGILCREGSFWDVFSDSISLGFNKWGRIMGYLLLLIICYTVVMVVLMLGFSFIMNAMHMTVIAESILILLNSVSLFFILCFSVVFYLDLTGITPQQTERENNIQHIP